MKGLGVPGMCLGEAGIGAGKRCKWLIHKPLEPRGLGLKIRASVDRFRPWPPFRSASYLKPRVKRVSPVPIWFPFLGCQRANAAATASPATALNPHTSKLSSPLNRTLPTSGVSLIAPGAACGMLKKG